MTKPPLPDDFVTFTRESHATDLTPIDVTRYVRLDYDSFDVHVLTDGMWEFDDNVSTETADRAFRECWEAYQRVIT